MQALTFSNEFVSTSLAAGGFACAFLSFLSHFSAKAVAAGKTKFVLPGPVTTAKRALTYLQATGSVLWEMACDVPEEFAYRWGKHFENAKRW